MLRERDMRAGNASGEGREELTKEECVGEVLCSKQDLVGGSEWSWGRSWFREVVAWRKKGGLGRRRATEEAQVVEAGGSRLGVGPLPVPETGEDPPLEQTGV